MLQVPHACLNSKAAAFSLSSTERIVLGHREREQGCTPAARSRLSTAMLKPRLHATYSVASIGAPLQSLPQPAGETPIRHCVPAQPQRPSQVPVLHNAGIFFSDKL